MSEPSKKHRFVAGALAATLGGLHAAAIVLYLLPDNPLSARGQSLAGTYVSTFWDQHWHLFSPDAPTSSNSLHVQCETAAGQSSGWLDTNAQVIREAYADPLGPTPKLRYVYNGAHDLIARARQTLQMQWCGEKADGLQPDAAAEACLAEHRDEIDDRLRTMPEYANAVRFARAACESHLPVGAEIVSVRLRSVQRFVWPFSQRDQRIPGEPYKLTYFEFPTFEAAGDER